MKTRNVLIALAAVAMFTVPAMAQEGGCCMENGQCILVVLPEECQPPFGTPVPECPAD